MLGQVSKEKFKENLGLDNKMSDYLLDWNFFLYSSRNQKYYTSLMEFKNNFCHHWSERQWGIYKELYQTYRFDNLIDGAFEFIEEHCYLIDEYGDDSLEIILEDYRNGN